MHAHSGRSWPSGSHEHLPWRAADALACPAAPSLACSLSMAILKDLQELRCSSLANESFVAGGEGTCIGGDLSTGLGDYISISHLVGQSEVAAMIRVGGWGVWEGILGRRWAGGGWRLGWALPPPHSTPPSNPPPVKIHQV